MHFKKLVLIMFLALLLTACGNKPIKEITYTTSNGEEITVEKTDDSITIEGGANLAYQFVVFDENGEHPLMFMTYDEKAKDAMQASMAFGNVTCEQLEFATFTAEIYTIHGLNGKASYCGLAKPDGSSDWLYFITHMDDGTDNNNIKAYLESMNITAGEGGTNQRDREWMGRIQTEEEKAQEEYEKEQEKIAEKEAEERAESDKWKIMISGEELEIASFDGVEINNGGSWIELSYDGGIIRYADSGVSTAGGREAILNHYKYFMDEFGADGNAGMYDLEIAGTKMTACMAVNGTQARCCFMEDLGFENFLIIEAIEYNNPNPDIGTMIANYIIVVPEGEEAGDSIGESVGDATDEIIDDAGTDNVPE